MTPTLPATPPDPPAAPARRRVLLPLPLSGAYDYALPADLAPEDQPEPGDFVMVPLGRRSAVGVVWDAETAPAQPPIPAEKLRPITAKLPIAALPPGLRQLVDWVANYTVTPPGAVLRMAISVAEALEPAAATMGYRLAADGATSGADNEKPRAGRIGAARISPGRRRVLALLADGRAWRPADLAAEAAVTPALLRAMATGGVLERIALPAPPEPEPPPPPPGPRLSADQAAAAGELVARVGAGFSVTLLAGVTGSGKTEVYYEAIAAALAADRQILVLLPEIALSTQWLERFQDRFGFEPILWHSGVGSGKRREAWRRIAAGRGRVVVGARSALFLPLDRLGLILIDEEHDPSFKQEDGVLYHARDMAVVRARIEAVPIVLVSATPSLETLTNVAAGRYRHLDLPDRHGGASLPTVQAVDLRRSPPPRGRFISPALAEAIAATLAAGDQALLFLNRRGYAPLTLCRTCGHRMECPNCSAWLVEHRLSARLACHHCGYATPVPQACPGCGAPGSMAACGPGVERLAEEAAALFPEARRALMTSDQVPDAAAAARLIGAMGAREIDLLIGTQMIAKGHHFPHLTCVGVIDADMGLAGGDLRAGERTFQLLHQVAGRAGRAERPGQVYLQTADPAHPVIAALIAGNGDAFLAAETEEREHHLMPPFGRLAALIVSGPDAAAVDRVARDLARQAPRGPDITVLGPAPAPLSLLRGRHRRRLLLKARRSVVVQPLLRDWLARVAAPSAVRITIDVDPYGFW